MRWRQAGTLSAMPCGVSRPVVEWLIRKLDPQPGGTVLELAAGSGETGLLATKLVGETGRLIGTDFAPGMVAAARERAHEMGIANVDFRVLDAERIDPARDQRLGAAANWASAAPASARRRSGSSPSVRSSHTTSGSSTAAATWRMAHVPA